LDKANQNLISASCKVAGDAEQTQPESNSSDNFRLDPLPPPTNQ